jgi:acetyl-CoA/propionyl-CoA carboxylase carboxyl transferase subunit
VLDQAVFTETLADYRDPAVRLSGLLDAGSLTPLHEPCASGVRAVRGRIAGADVFAYCTDARVMGGAMTAAGCRHIVTAIDAAVCEGRPVIGVLHSGGAALADGVEALDGVGRVFAAMIRASGRVAQISVVLGPAAGGAAYGPALTDLVIMSAAGRIFVTGPDVVRSVTGEQIDMLGLGGPEAHGRKSGVAHVVAGSEEEALAQARRVSGYFARPGIFAAHLAGPGQDLRALLPDQPRRAYDVHPVIRAILDAGDPGDPGGGFAELQPDWARNIVVGLGRLCGRTIGVIANNPLRKGGCLDSLSAEKTSRFVRMCNALGIPLLVLVDVPGYLPGVGQEWGGVVRRGAKLLHAFGEAVVPRVTLITRKSYGGAYIAMNSRALGASAVFAWPEAEIAVMGAEAAVGILHRKRLAAVPEAEQPALRELLVREHEVKAGGVGRAVGLGLVDEVIDPRHTRRKLVEAFAAAPPGRGQHGNIPL